MPAQKNSSSLLHWLPSLWLAFVIFRFARVAIRTLHASGEHDVNWAIRWMALALAAVISTLILSRSVGNRIWFITLGVTAAAIILLTGTALPILGALFVLLVSAGFGEFVLQRFRLGATPAIERLVLTTPLGLGFLALGELALAAFGQFTPTTVWILVLACAFPAIAGLRRLAQCKTEIRLGEHSLLWILFGALCVLNLTWATVPELQFDANNVHLAVPRLYLQNGGLLDLPYFWNSYMAHLMSMVYSLGLVYGGVLAVKTIVFVLGILAAGGVFEIGRRLFSEEVGMWSALLFYSTPLVLWSSTTAYLDLAQSFFVSGCALAFFRWYDTSEWKWLAVSGAIAGVAAGNKIAGLSTLIVFPLIAALTAVMRFIRGQSWLPTVYGLVAFTLLLLIVCVPWYAVAYDYTGNPFFPMLNGIFKSPQAAPENTMLDWPTFGMGTSLGAFARIPFRFTWETSGFGPFPRGSAGFGLLLLVPLGAVYLWKGTLQERVLLAAIAVHIGVWAFTAQYARYYIPVLPFVLPLGCALFLAQKPAIVLHVNRALLLAGVLVQQPVASGLFWNLPERYPLAHAFGRESRKAFMLRALPGWGAAQYLNGLEKREGKVLGIGMESVRFYFDSDVYMEHYATVANPNMESLENLRKELLRDGVRYIAAVSWEIDKPRIELYAYMDPQFLARFTEKVYNDGRSAVFRIKDP